jgi:hypothetical protein
VRKGEGIVTRSRGATLGPQQFTMVSLPAKIFGLLADCLIEQFEQRRDEVKRSKSCDRNVRDFGWGSALAAVTRRPPISLDTMVPRTGSYTYDVGV